MSAITTGDFAKSVAPQLPIWFGLGYERNPALYEQVFNVSNMDQKVEEEALISGAGLMLQTAEGESTPYDRMKQGYVKRYEAIDYRLGLIITKNMIRDGRGLQIAEQRAKALGLAYMETKNTVAFNVLNRAFNSSYTGADGVELCATNHATVAGNMSNELAVAADLSEASIEQAYIEMGDIKDDRGLRIQIRPKKLLIPRALTFEAHRILDSTGRSATTDNDTNVIRDQNMFPGGIVVSDYLTDADAFFILTNQDMQGLSMKIRQDLELTDDTHFDTDNAKFKAHARFDASWTDFRCIFGSPGAA